MSEGLATTRKRKRPTRRFYLRCKCGKRERIAKATYLKITVGDSVDSGCVCGWQRHIQIEHICISCGKYFARRNNEYTCSYDCRLFYDALVKDRRRGDKDNPNKLTKPQWLNAVEYFGGGCAVCGKNDNVILHQDHWLPLSKGGEYIAENIIPLCSGCNSSKNHKMPIEWLSRSHSIGEIIAIVNRVDSYFKKIGKGYNPNNQLKMF